MQQTDDAKVTIDHPAWEWLYILRAARQALNPAKVTLAAAGLLLTVLLGYAMDSAWRQAGADLDADALRESPLVVRLHSDPQARYGISEVLLQHQRYCLEQALTAARRLDLTGQMGEVWGRLLDDGGPQVRPSVAQGYGAIAFIVAMGEGVYWLARHHALYAVVFGVLGLALWSVVGGAVCRISALQFARDERPSMKEAVGYATAKFIDHFWAPLLPVLVVLLLGLALWVGGWLMHVPVLSWLVFVLSLLAGFMMALAIVGTLGGFSLMWPTVAVEGLDWTDAMSRSYTYVFDRLLRSLLYALVAVIIGALLWLLVKFFAVVMAYGTHGFLTRSYAPLEHMWSTPTFDRPFGLSWTTGELGGLSKYATFPVVAALLCVLTFVVYGVLVSYYFTASTIVYLLLRRSVDEAEFEDLHLETVEAVVDDAPAPPPPRPQEDS